MRKRQQFLRCQKCATRCGAHNVPYEVLRMIHMGFARLEWVESPSLLKKHLTRDNLDRLKHLKTWRGTNLYDCIKSGLENIDSKVGVYACDPETYFVFSELFNKIIEDYHQLGPNDIHPKTYWGPYGNVLDIDPYQHYIITIRMRLSRNLFGFPFMSMMSQKDFLKIERKAITVLNLLTGQHEGEYITLEELDKEATTNLIGEGLLFDDRDKFLKSANAYKYWPKGRGLYLNNYRNFCVWINEEDHIKIFSLEKGGRFQNAYQRLVRGIKKIEQDIKFIESKRLGYVTFDPTNIGTALKISVNIRLPVQATRPDDLVAFCTRNHCVVTNIEEEMGPAPKGYFNLCNTKKAGWNEAQIVQSFVQTVNSLMEKERLMQRDYHLLMSSGKAIPA